MQRNFKLALATLVLLAMSYNAFAQDTSEFKDVILDGKPAKLNVATGEITLVKTKDKVVKMTTTSDTSKPKTVSDNTVVNSLYESGSDDSDFYIVKENETLFDVSKKYNVSLADLKRANNLETTLINKGQKLRIKNLEVTDVVVESEVKAKNYTENNNSNFHIVEKGNTLFSLSRRYNLSVKELKNLNHLSSNLIKVGQRLRVQPNEASSEEASPSVYIVKKGDNLYRISLNNGITVDTIKRLNGLTSNTIIIGQKLRLK